MASGDLRMIVVKSLDNQRLEYKISKNDTVARLRQEVHRDTGLSSEQIRLIFRAQALTDDQSIGELFAEDGQVVHLAARLVPPGEETRDATPTATQQPEGGQQPFLPPDVSSAIASMTQAFTTAFQGAGVNFANLVAAAAPPPPRPVATFTVFPPPQPPREFIAQQRRPNELLAVRPDSFTLSLDAVGGGEPSQHTLSTTLLHELNALNTRMRGVEVRVPRRRDQNTSAGMLAEYLHTLHGSLFEFLPQLARVQALLANEALLREPEARQRAGRLVRAIGRYLSALTPTIEPLRALDHFDFGPEPGAFGLRRAPPPPQQSARPNSPRPPPSDVERQEREREAERQERDRREFTRLMGVFQEGVTLGTSMEQLMSRVSEEPEKDNDIISLVTRNLTLNDLIAIKDDQTCLDHHHAQIATSLRALIVKCENNQQKLREELLDSLIMPLRRALRENAELFPPNFDFRACLEKVNDEFVDQFRQVVLRDYSAASMPFSAAFTMTLKLYLGRLVFELSLAAADGVASVEALFRLAFIRYSAELAAGFDVAPLFDLFWPKVREGYLINRSLHRHRLGAEGLAHEARLAREEDQHVPPQPPLSEEYTAGNLRLP